MSILSPPEGARVRDGALQLRVEVIVPAGDRLRDLPVWINGKRSAASRDLLLEQPAGTTAGQGRLLLLSIPPGRVTIEVAAETTTAQSARALLHVLREGPAARGPRLSLLSVGISQYQEPQFALGLAAKDARDVARAFQAQRGKAFRDVQARLLTDGVATRSGILEGLAWLRRETEESDVALLFLAGHGIEDPQGGRGYYFLPVEATSEASPTALLSGEELQAALDEIPGQVLVLLDTCHSGGAIGAGQRLRAAAPDRLGEQLRESHRVTVIAASRSFQVSLERAEWGNGAFTLALTEGLRGKADKDGNGEVKMSELEGYVNARVAELTTFNQTPATFKHSFGDLLLARVPRPLYYRPWFWGALGLIAAGAAVTLAVALSPRPGIATFGSGAPY